MRLIDADTLKMTTLTKWNGDVEFIVYKKDIDEAPTIKCEKQTDSALDKKTAEWEVYIDCEGKTRQCTCKNCGYKTGKYTWKNPNYCPNCGSFMRKGENQ